MMKKNFQCLMLELRDGRRFFTFKKHYNQLIEFINTFKPKVSIVVVQKGEVLSLAELSQAVCANGKTSEVKFSKIKSKKSKKTRGTLLKEDIRRTFLGGRLVNLRDIHKKHKMSVSSICSYISKVKKELLSEGYVIKKVGPGKYEIS